MNGIGLQSVVARAVLEQAVAVHLRHLDVGEHDVDVVLAEHRDRLASVAGFEHLVALGIERHATASSG